MIIIKKLVPLNISWKDLPHDVIPNIVRFKIFLNHSIFLWKVPWQKCMGERTLQFKCHTYPGSKFYIQAGVISVKVCLPVISSLLGSPPYNFQEDFHRHRKFMASEFKQLPDILFYFVILLNELADNLCTFFPPEIWYFSSR